MPYRKTIYGDATTRLRFSQKNVVNQQAINRLNHALDVFRDSTGLQPRGARGVLPPEGMTTEQKEVFDSIIENFLNDSRSAQKIRQDYKNAPLKDKDKKAKTIQAQENVLLKNERVASDERLHKEIYSNTLKEVWELSSKWIGKDDPNKSNRVYKAMIDTLDEMDKKLENGIKYMADANGNKLLDEYGNPIPIDSTKFFVDNVIDKMESGFY